MWSIKSQLKILLNWFLLLIDKLNMLVKQMLQKDQEFLDTWNFEIYLIIHLLVIEKIVEYCLI